MGTQQHHNPTWPGFSPGPMSVTMSPEQTFGFNNPMAGESQMESPLVFKRTPAQHQDTPPCPDSSKRFNSWMQSTSPYTGGRKTPPTASMKSVAPAGEEENTPPPVHAGEPGTSFGNQQHFQAWLAVTSSTSWTPRKSPAAATPPPPPAPSPAAPTPMSIMRDLTHSAATPPAACQQQQQQQGGAEQAPRHPQPGAAGSSAAAAGGAQEPERSEDLDTDDDDDFGEASTTVGAAEVDAAARRAANAHRMAAAAAAGRAGDNVGGLCQPHSTPLRVPAPSPAEAALAGPQETLAGGGGGDGQEALLQAAAASLATPLSQLSLGRRAATTPTLTGGAGGFSHAAGAGAAQAASSPVQQLIGLMLSPAGAKDGGQGRSARHHTHHQHAHAHQQHQQQQHTPSRLSGAAGQYGVGEAGLSPTLQVINLMMQAGGGGGEDGDGGAEGTGGNVSTQPQDASSSSSGGMQRQWQPTPHAAAAAAAAPQLGGAPAPGEAPVPGAAGGACSSATSTDGGSDSVYESASDDEMDVAELAALCGEGALGPDTPLSAILGMMLTPQACGLTTGLGAPAGAEQQAAADDLNPRVLFADADE